MKVLFVTNYPSPYRVHFFNELGKLCNLTVVFEETPEQQIHRDAKWFYTKYDNFTAVFLKNYPLGKSKNGMPPRTISPSIIGEVKKLYDIRIIGVYSTYSAILAILYMQKRKIPYWIETDGGMAKNGEGFQEKLKKKLISGAIKYFSPSSESDQYLMHYGADENAIIRYPFTSLFNKDILKEIVPKSEKISIRKKLEMTEGHIILSVGQFIHRKGFDILLEAVSEIQDDIGVYIIGGVAPKEYIKLRTDLGLDEKVHFVDFKEKNELIEYYKAADLFVLPTREDIWGLVINEAMAYGLPIITTNKCVAGMELVKENGILVETENVSDLSKAIKKMLKCDIDFNGEKSLEVIRKYTFENMAKIHKEAFQ